jgi:alpha,alpha-trehalose-phosphate synthase [UDP-forming]
MPSRLIIVSNRAPVEVERRPDGLRVTRTVGGLAGSLDDALRAHGGLWIAWVGAHGGDELPPNATGLPYPIRAVRLKERELNDYYAGFANQVLWPLCHMFPSRVRLQATYWNAYRQANERFAGAVQAAVCPGDRVWIHDFHLCLVPAMLRAAGVPARLGVFWHIPFPPPPVFGILRWRADLLAGLLGADLIAFQTEPDVANFLAGVRQFLDLPVREGPARVVLPEREVRVCALPIGIDYPSFRAQAADPAVQARAARLRETLGAELLLLGVDRLDYTKGILERLRGYERFLERHAEWRRRVCLVQIAVPSRDRVPEYRDLKRAIDEAVGRIGGRFTYEGRTPLRYMYTGLSREALVAYYQAADVALVTPLRDGMNLVAKEYVACRADADGILLLSEFAGAAQELREAVQVNPYDPEAIRRALELSVAMSPGERRRRMRALDRRVATRDLAWWTRAFLDRLDATAGPTATAA